MSDVVTRYILDTDSFVSPLKEIHALTGDFNKALGESAKAQKDFSQSIVKSVDERNKAFRDGLSEMGKTIRTQEQMQDEFQKLISVTKALGVAQKSALSTQAYDKLQGEIVQTKQRMEELKKEASETGVKLKGVGKEDGTSGGILGGLFGKLGGVVGKFAAVLGGIQVAELFKDFVLGSTKAAIAQEKTNISFEVFLGDAKKAQVLVKDLNKLGDITPFENDQLIEAGKALLAFGIESEKIIPSLKTIGDISAGTGKDINELAVIYGKARTQGTLFAEDINQLTEAGVPIIQEFAKQLGVTEGEVKKLASEGKINFGNLEKAFVSLTSEGGRFFNLMERQSQSVDGKASTFFSNFKTRAKEATSALLPLIGGLLDFGNRIIGTESEADRLTKKFELQKEAVSELSSNVLPLAKRYDELTGQSKLSKEEQTELDSIIKQLSSSVPTAITAFDNYGKAVKLSTAEIRKFDEQQKAILKVSNKDAIAARVKELQSINQEIVQTIEALNKRNKQGNVIRVEFNVGGPGAIPVAQEIKLTGDEIQKLQAKLADLQETKLGTEGLINKLKGVKDVIKATGDEGDKAAKKLGLIEEIEIKIAKLQEAQKKAQTKPEIDRIGDELKVQQSNLDALLGKSNEEYKKLQADLIELTKKIEQAKLELLKPDSHERLAAELQAELETINEFEKKLLEDAAKSGRKLTSQQVEQVGLLRELAGEKFLKKSLDLQQKQDDELFALQRQSDEKDIQEVERTYARRLEEVEKGSEKELLLIAERDRKIAELKTNQGLKKIDNQEQIEIAQVERTLIPADDNEIKFEEVKQKAILAVRLKYAKIRLEELENAGKKEDAVQIEQLITTIAGMERDLGKLNEKKEKFSVWKLIGLDPDDPDGQKAIKAIQDAVAITIDSLNQVLQAELQANQERIDSLTQSIDDKESELDREIALNRQGFASNVEGKRKEVEDLKVLRAQAIEDQRKTQKIQQTINDAMQLSQIFTAIANIIAGWSEIPIVGSVAGIVAVGAMLASFVAAKAQAQGAIKLREGGLLVGPSHEQGGIKGTGRFNHIEVEGEEYVVNKKSTKKHRELVEAINEDDFTKVSKKTIHKILKQTKIAADPKLPERLTESRTTLMVMQSEGNTALLREINNKLDRLENLDRIAKHTGNIPEEQIVQTDEGLLHVSKRGTRLVKKKQ